MNGSDDFFTESTAQTLVIGVDVEGRKHALGRWIAETEGAKFWHSVLTQLRNRGLRDILIACCDCEDRQPFRAWPDPYCD